MEATVMPARKNKRFRIPAAAVKNDTCLTFEEMEREIAKSWAQYEAGEGISPTDEEWKEWLGL
ncbi:hypothetical protein Barb6XT_02106 [Bacteroidales bacterium Barb6XT]|nr:hypothetical protein Barb6XT_02106 [Bacteroidales bacterium Barb6XT]